MTMYACCDHCSMRGPHEAHATPCAALCSKGAERAQGLREGGTSETEADECAHTALSLIYRRERDEARAERDVARSNLARLAADIAFGAETTSESPRPHIPPPYTPKPVRSGLDGERAEPCPDSCGGQSWTGVDQAEGPGKVWRCDTCGRIISQSVSNPMQAADDRRAL